MDELSSCDQEVIGNCLLPSLPAVLPAVCSASFVTMNMLQSNLGLWASKALEECLPICGYILGFNRTVLAHGLLDTLNSWQLDKVKALLDHAGTDQCGLFMSLGMGLMGCSCLGAALGDHCLPLMSSAGQCWPFGDFWLCLAGCALLFHSFSCKPALVVVKPQLNPVGWGSAVQRSQNREDEFKDFMWNTFNMGNWKERRKRITNLIRQQLKCWLGI